MHFSSFCNKSENIQRENRIRGVDAFEDLYEKGLGKHILPSLASYWL